MHDVFRLSQLLFGLAFVVSGLLGLFRRRMTIAGAIYKGRRALIFSTIVTLIGMILIGLSLLDWWNW